MRPFIEQISECDGNRSVPEFPATKPRGDATYSRMGEKLAAEIIAERPTDVRPRKLADACGEETRSKIAAIGDASSVAHDTVHQGAFKARSIPHAALRSSTPANAMAVPAPMRAPVGR